MSEKPTETLAPTVPPAPGEPWTVLRLMRWSGQYLEEKGVPGGRLDAEHLLADALGVGRLELYLQYDRPVADVELSDFKERLLRRSRREPLQYILGSASFRSLDLSIDRRVLIPRPETEVLVDVVLTWSGRRGGANLHAVDIGTGSGAIALALLQEGPFDRVVAIDLSESALALASANAAALGLEEGFEACAGDLFQTLKPGERFHVVVSNPPYVGTSEADTLEPEVKDWEPEEALFSGEDGTELLARLIAESPVWLAPGGLLALEVGLGQSDHVCDLIHQTGRFGPAEVHKDLSRRDRIVSAELTE